MFHLGGSDFPNTRDQLAAAVTEGLRGLLTLPARPIVTIEGGDYPPYTQVTVDLTGAKMDAEQLPPEPKGVGQGKPGAFTSKLAVVGHPVYVRGAAVDLSLSALNASFDYDRDANGKPVLALTDAKDGRVTLEIAKSDLDALVLIANREGAAKQGVQILETNLILTQLDERSVAAEARVKAKRMFFTATIILNAKLSIDDALNAKLYDLTITGEGMMGEMAGSVIRPKLQKIEGKSFPLTALSLGQVRLRDLRLQVGDSLKVTAAFGS